MNRTAFSAQFILPICSHAKLRSLFAGIDKKKRDILFFVRFEGPSGFCATPNSFFCSAGESVPVFRLSRTDLEISGKNVPTRTSWRNHHRYTQTNYITLDSTETFGTT